MKSIARTHLKIGQIVHPQSLWCGAAVFLDTPGLKLAPPISFLRMDTLGPSESTFMADEDVAETAASPSKSIDPPSALESSSQLQQPSPALPLKLLLLWAAGAVASFHLAYSSLALSWLIVLYLYCLLQLTK